ncbi:hypothetical protein K501DRAFT_254502 [Backusella circina FSU 941]|nr:hypothetical protein K501DRAFT_254502 [Backusella circina FSU 941]
MPWFKSSKVQNHNNNVDDNNCWERTDTTNTALLDDRNCWKPPTIDQIENSATTTTTTTVQNKYAPTEQNEELPMDIGSLQDIFSFTFMKGRPILNFILAILWSIGLPILLYELLKPRIGQIAAMIIASAPPLLIVVARMVKERVFDPLGCVAGISFLISGLVSIAQPDDKTSAICDSIVSLLVGVCCVLSLIPIKIGSFEMRPFVFQMANQIMPRNEEDEAQQKQDDLRISNTSSGRKRLDYLYTNMSRFRRDMRVMTFCWGSLLIITFIIKVIIVETSTDISKAQTQGYILFGVMTILIGLFTWFYTNVVKGHVFEQVKFWKTKQQQEQGMNTTTETANNLNWGVNAMSNTFGQVMG